MTDHRPHPPGTYPVVVVGSGPGGLQMAYLLRRRGIDVAHLSADPAPGGMFRRLPLFDRLLSWSKPAPPEPGRGVEWADWNLLVADPADRMSPRRFMADGALFPTRPEMVAALEAFVDHTGLAIRYGCRWTATTRDPDGGYLLETTDGSYRTGMVVVATGMAEPWQPPIPGIELAVDYQAMADPASYTGCTVLVIGKQNSGFEVAGVLLPRTARVIVVGPGPTRFTVTTHSFAGARARFDGVYEDAVVGGGTLVLDGDVTAIRPGVGGLEVDLRLADRDASVSVDHVIAATGFAADLSPLAGLAPATKLGGRLPKVTPGWELEGHRGIFVAGTLTQAAAGPRPFGVPSTSASIQGFRYNAVITADEIASRLGRPRVAVPVADPVDHLLSELAHSPGLMSQKGYLASTIRRSNGGWVSDGLQTVAAFTSGTGAGLAATIEPGPEGVIHPALYLRRHGETSQHLLEPDPFLAFDTPELHDQLAEIVRSLALEKETA